jgi:hypothetical protein
MATADSAPQSAADLKTFVDKISKETGLKIVYGDEMLLKDDWVTYTHPNKEYGERLRQTLEEIKKKKKDANIYHAYLTDVQKTK